MSQIDTVNGSGSADILVIPQVPRVAAGDDDVSVPRATPISAANPLNVGERVRTTRGMATVTAISGQRATLRLDYENETADDIRRPDGSTGVIVDSTGASGSGWSPTL